MSMMSLSTVDTEKLYKCSSYLTTRSYKRFYFPVCLINAILAINTPLLLSVN